MSESGKRGLEMTVLRSSSNMVQTLTLTLTHATARLNHNLTHQPPIHQHFNKELPYEPSLLKRCPE